MAILLEAWYASLSPAASASMDRFWYRTISSVCLSIKVLLIRKIREMENSPIITLNRASTKVPRRKIRKGVARDTVEPDEIRIQVLVKRCHQHSRGKVAEWFGHRVISRSKISCFLLHARKDGMPQEPLGGITNAHIEGQHHKDPLQPDVGYLFGGYRSKD